MALDLRNLYKKAVSDFFEIMKSEDSIPEFITFFDEAEKSMYLLINSAPDINVLKEIFQDAYTLAEKAALTSPPVKKKLKTIKDKHEALINKAVNKSLILSEEKRLNKSAITENLVCPDCNQFVSKEADFCPYCGIELIKCMFCISVIGGNQEFKTCSNCGESAHFNCITKSDGKCVKCGTLLSM
ncbi:MAG: hypothetical protein ACETWM_02270 [Candidatus Lokiarchaeia archaeon]